MLLSWIHGTLGSSPVRIGPFILTPVFNHAYGPLAGITVLGMAYAALTAFRPEFGRFRKANQVLGTAVWLATFGYLLTSGPWVAISESVGTPEERQRGAQFLNDHFVRYGLISMVVVLAFVLISELFSLARKRPTDDR